MTLALSPALRAVYVIWLRDVQRFLREKTRVLAMIGQPVLYLVILGYGLGYQYDSTLFVGKEFLQFLFPGVIGMAILFASVFAAVSIIWDREFGFMKEILAAPVPRWSVVLGKVLGGSTLAMAQGMALLLLAPLMDIHVSAAGAVRLLALMFLMAIAFTSLGMVLAPLMGSHEGFQVVMSFLVLPVFLLSGAFFPIWSAPTNLQRLMKVDPLAYGVDAMRNVFFDGSPLQGFAVSFAPQVNLVVLHGFAVAMLAAAVLVFYRVE